MKILFEDKFLIFAEKPVGVLSQSGEGENMIDLLSEGRGEIFPIHRLDKNVGGVMVFAKTKSAAARLSAMVQNNEIQKRYLAVLCGIPREKSAVLEDLLFKDSSKNKSFVVKRMRKGVKSASLEYEILSTAEHEGKPLSLVEVLLHTGRTHQIRVQFSSRKLPLLGDGRYGGKSPLCDVALWSHSLTLKHPFSGETLHFEVEPPEEFPWNMFLEKEK